MSFGGGFGSSGFGSTNNQPSGGFGFGQQNSNASGGFGSTGSAFGAGNTNSNSNTNAGSSLFGGGGSTAGGSAGFGSGGFGSNNAGNSSPFGAAKPFGTPAATTGTSLFGGGSTATTGGGFGSGGFGANNTSAPAFGSSAGTGGGGLFGAQNKPAFGGGTGGGLFGGGAAATTPAPAFGATNTGSAFGGGGATAGFGANNNALAQNNGTASVPFQAHVEKDGAGASATNSHYQTITFQQPYQAYSLEELRLADYTAGRRYGNSNGQAGAFGTSTGFGGFGSTNTAASTAPAFGAQQPSTGGGGLFGNNAAASSPFGAQNNTAGTGFGGGSTGGLFGQNKPAGTTGGLFGASTSTPAATGTTGGGLFGSAGTSNTGGGFGGGFGATNNAASNTGGGLFGAANNTQQNKPAFGGFGATATPAATNTGFGGFGATNNNNTTGGGLFGQNNNTAQQQPATGGGLFGQTNTQQNTNTTGGGLFGGGGGFGSQNNASQQQQQQQPATGGGLFGGGFGANNQNAQKPGGLFGNTQAPSTGGGLFGGQQQNQQPSTGGGLFGNQQPQNQQQNAGGLFGAKPATGGGLFGSSTAQTGNTGGGLFGNTQQNQQQNAGGLFGAKPATGGGLFGNSQQGQQQQSGGLFGNSQQNQQPSGGLFGSSTNQQPSGGLFGASQQQNQPQNQQPALAATLLSNPYGNDQLFANLGTPTQPVGPLATPLSGAQKSAKRPTPLPQFKINPTASLRLITPQKRTNSYGLNYSTYGTPGSASSFTSNGLGSSLLQSGSLSRSLGRSFSATSLRSTLTSNEDSVLAPGAFTPNSRPYSGGSIRRLKIDRNLRTDLFGTESASEPSTLKQKRVSFDATGMNPDRIRSPLANGESADASPSNALVRRTETPEPESNTEDSGILRAPRPSTNGAKVNGATPRQEMEQVKSSELPSVPENGPAPDATTAAKSSASQADKQEGDYYMIPSIQDLRNMSRDQLKKVENFEVGRVHVGKVNFNEPVDLTSVALDEIMGGIVQLGMRSATVYAEGGSPPVGKGLNVPSTISLENSWPRSSRGQNPIYDREGPRYEKHLQRLQRVVNTEFVSYDPDTGIWVFKVEHFTTYGLDDSDDDDADEALDADMTERTDDATPRADTPGLRTSDTSELTEEETSVMSEEESNPDDTFDFKKGPSKNLPGGFGDQSLYRDEAMADETDAQDEDSSFLGQRGTSTLEDPFRSSGSAPAVQATFVPIRDHHMEDEAEEDEEEDVEMVGSFPKPAAPEYDFGDSIMPRKSILKNSTVFFGTPNKDAKKEIALAGDWAEQLQRTVSPRKQDRRAVRERLAMASESPVKAAPFTTSVTGKPFSTTIDIMNSLWEPTTSLKKSTRDARALTGGMGFEWPYDKRFRKDAAKLSEMESAFHSSFKPSWANDNTLAYTIAGNAAPLSGNMKNTKHAIVSEHKDVRFAKFHISKDDKSLAPLKAQMSRTAVALHFAGIPTLDLAQMTQQITFSDMARNVTGDTPQAKHERTVWKVASILFDDVHVASSGFSQTVSEHSQQRVRKETLSRLWAQLVHEDAAAAAKDAGTAEEKAVAFLSRNDIEEACAALLDGNDYRLATIISQLPGDKTLKETMGKQIDAWRSQNVLSEMSEPVRALYDIVAGNVCTSEGKGGPPEDRASTFNISSRFGLDWRRSFGLRLWYGNQETDDLADAIHAYVDDVAAETEKVRPVPYFTEERLSTAWDDPSTQDREDTLFGLLKLYARKPSFAGASARTSLADLLAPSAVSGSPLDARLSWQLAVLLRNKKIATPTDIPDSMLDALTLSLSAQLEDTGDLTNSLKTLVHLSNRYQRAQLIKSLLSRRASALYNPEAPDTLPNALTQELHIPEQWMWKARAFHARSVLVDHNLETTCYLRAGEIVEAHKVLCEDVAPHAVIEQDYDSLRKLLNEFHELRQDVKVANWSIGGQVFLDFVQMLDLQGRDISDSRVRNEQKAILARLTDSLPGMSKTLKPWTGHRTPGTKLGIEKRVAVAEMAEAVKREAERIGREERGVDQDMLAKLPTAAVDYAQSSVALARAFYGAVAA